MHVHVWLGYVGGGTAAAAAAFSVTCIPTPRLQMVWVCVLQGLADTLGPAGPALSRDIPTLQLTFSTTCSHTLMRRSNEALLTIST